MLFPAQELKSRVKTDNCKNSHYTQWRNKEPESSDREKMVPAGETWGAAAMSMVNRKENCSPPF
jgi:hypothetical protein